MVVICKAAIHTSTQTYYYVVDILNLFDFLYYYFFEVFDAKFVCRITEHTRNIVIFIKCCTMYY